MKHFLKNPFLPDSDLKEIIVGAAAEPFINDFNALGIKTRKSFTSSRERAY